VLRSGWRFVFSFRGRFEGNLKLFFKTVEQRAVLLNAGKAQPIRELINLTVGEDFYTYFNLDFFFSFFFFFILSSNLCGKGYEVVVKGGITARLCL